MSTVKITSIDDVSENQIEQAFLRLGRSVTIPAYRKDRREAAKHVEEIAGAAFRQHLAIACGDAPTVAVSDGE